jgi:hypothetical protein
MPTVKFDPSTVSESVKANLRRNIWLLNNIEKKHFRQIYEISLRSVVSGDLHLFCTELMNIHIQGMTTGWAAEIGRSLSNKAKAIICNERRTALGITHAVWMYAHAPCVVDPHHPTAAELRQDAAHKEADRKRYDLSEGLLVDGKWTWPGVENGCKCSSRIVLPGCKEQEHHRIRRPKAQGL